MGQQTVPQKDRVIISMPGGGGLGNPRRRAVDAVAQDVREGFISAESARRDYGVAITAGGLLALLEAAWRVVPSVEELPVEEMWVGHRPGSRDDAPILGPAQVEGLVYATGHHRNGILLAPVTADMIARLVIEGTVDPAIRPFGLERFLPARAAE